MSDLSMWDPEETRRRAEADPAYVHSHDKYGHTPLIAAASSGDVDLVVYLLERGADPNARTVDGYSPLLWAVESDEAGASAVAARLIAAGADLHGVALDGWTPLHLAAIRGRADLCRLLLDAGAEIDRRATIDDGRTPLMEAAAAGKFEAVSFLLDRGADPSLRDEMFGRTARELAMDAGGGCNHSIYEQLKENPIDVDPDAILADLDLDEEMRVRLRERMANHDMAEFYRESANRNAVEGRHADVVRLLDVYEARRVGLLRHRFRRCRAFFHAWASGLVRVRFEGRWRRPRDCD